MRQPASGNNPPAAPPRKGRPRRSLATRLVLIMLAVSLVPLVLMGGAWLAASGQQVRTENELVMGQTADGLAGQVDEWVDKNVRILQAAARMPAIAAMQEGDQVAVVKAIQETYPWMYLVFTVGLDGRSLARSDGKPQTDYSDRSYFRDVALLGQPVAWQNLIGKTSGLPALVVAVPIKANGSLVGVMAAAMTIEQVSSLVATWHKGATGHAFIVDERDKVMSHPRGDYVTAQQLLHDHPLLRALRQAGHATGLLQFTTADGVPMVGVARSNRYNWALVVEQEDAEVFAGLRRARLVIGLLVALTLALVALVAWRTGTALVRPIVGLTEVADRISLGDLGAEIAPGADDEIGRLAQSFARLQVSLRRAMARLQHPEAPSPGQSTVRPAPAQKTKSSPAL